MQFVVEWIRFLSAEQFPLKRAAAVVGVLVFITAALWIAAGILVNLYMQDSLAMLVISYTLGLRHALDADHIAAIDNVTRRMVQNGQQPVTVGLFFSLGHSTIVIIATMLVAGLSSSIVERLDSYSSASGVIGPAISASFLLLIGTINAVSMCMIAKTLSRLRNRSDGEDVDWQTVMDSGGFFARTFGKHLFRVIDAPWKMYPVGLLFGLGFETATEIALIGIASSQAAKGSSGWLILFFPSLFTCGMTLLDTVDGILMLGVYAWASITPSQKLFYNLVITAVSFLFALIVAVLIILEIFQSNYELSGIFWDSIAAAGEDKNFGVIGVSLLISIAMGWLWSRHIYRMAGAEDKATSPTAGAAGGETTFSVRESGVPGTEAGCGEAVVAVGSDGTGAGAACADVDRQSPAQDDGAGSRPVADIELACSDLVPPGQWVEGGGGVECRQSLSYCGV